MRRSAWIDRPSPQPSGHQPEISYPELAQALQQAHIDAGSVDLIAKTIEDVRQEAKLAGVCTEHVSEVVEDAERLLADQALTLDPETMRKVCARWTQWAEHALNPAGAEPTDAQLSNQQGLRYHGRRRGLHHWSLDATDRQHEVLRTIAGAASSPRSGAGRADSDSGAEASTSATTSPPPAVDNTDAESVADDSPGVPSHRPQKTTPAQGAGPAVSASPPARTLSPGLRPSVSWTA